MAGMEPLQLLFERPGLQDFALGPESHVIYGGALGFARPRLFANFVASVDGVVALRAGKDSSAAISQKSEAARLVRALLRACAEAVLIGAGTFRAAPGHVWDAEHIFPVRAREF